MLDADCALPENWRNIEKNQSIKIDKMAPWIRFISNLVKLHYPFKTMC